MLSRIVAMRDEYEDIIRSIVVDGTRAAAFHPGDVKMATFAVLAISNQPAYWFRGMAISRPKRSPRRKPSWQYGFSDNSTHQVWPSNPAGTNAPDVGMRSRNSLSNPSRSLERGGCTRLSVTVQRRRKPGWFR